MKRVLILSNGTGQSKEFNEAIKRYTKENNILVDWIFSNEEYINKHLKCRDIDLVLISPEMMLVEEHIKKDLEENSLPYINLKPVDFGLKRVDKVISLIINAFK